MCPVRPLVAATLGFLLALAATGCASHRDDRDASATAAPSAAPAASPLSNMVRTTSPGARPTSRTTPAVAQPPPEGAEGSRSGGTQTPAAAPTDAPRTAAFLSVSVSPSVVHSGDTVRWDVVTTPDVDAVEAHVRIASFSLQKVGAGHFALAFTIPKGVPGMFHGAYDVQVTGHAGSRTISRSVPLDFQ